MPFDPIHRQVEQMHNSTPYFFKIRLRIIVSGSGRLHKKSSTSIKTNESYNLAVMGGRSLSSGARSQD